MLSSAQIHTSAGRLCAAGTHALARVIMHSYSPIFMFFSLISCADVVSRHKSCNVCVKMVKQTCLVAYSLALAFRLVDSYAEMPGGVLQFVPALIMLLLQVKWGIDLSSEHERYLAERVFKSPVIVYNYPREIKVCLIFSNCICATSP